ncbi:MAG TPA: ATP-binding protein, partial [Gemmatales bacterium]|nr:ATP-binding protein [Gemmatales bacterium]
FRYLFSEEAFNNPNAAGFITDVEEWLTDGTPESPRLKTQAGVPRTFEELLDFFRPKTGEAGTLFNETPSATRAAFYRRLKYVVKEGDGVLRRQDEQGNPLRIPSTGTNQPIVIDLYALYRAPSLQRFVVAAVFHQIMMAQSSSQTTGLKYLITLDELNRFAPRGGRDPITEQIELVAAEGRSQGIILLGAQQQASLVSSRVIENCAIRAVGRSGTLELEHDLWKFLGSSARRVASQLPPEDKLLYQPSFREPMLVKMPFPPFALSAHDVWQDYTGRASSSKADLDAF